MDLHVKVELSLERLSLLSCSSKKNKKILLASVVVSVPCAGLAIADIQQVSLKWFVTLHHDQSTASFSHQTFGEKYNNSSHQKIEGIAQMVKLVACQVKSPDFHNDKHA